MAKDASFSQPVSAQLLLHFAQADGKQKPLTHAAISEARVRRKSEDVWYFAYGSNMSVNQKEFRTGRIRQALNARLMDYRIAFSKKGIDGYVRANIVNSPGSVAWGVAYLCDPAAMKALDRHEGVRDGHYCRSWITLETTSGVLQAVAYIAGKDFPVEEGQPTNQYLEAILSGAREHGLPDEYIHAVETLARNRTQT